MEVDQDEKRIRAAAYGPSPTIHQHRMQPSDSVSHSYPPPSGPASNYSNGPLGWAPPPSPFANEPRPITEVSQHSNSYPPPSRETTFAPEVSYGSRTGSISAPTRSPGDGHIQAHPVHVNPSNPEGPYQSQQAPEYRNRSGYVPPDLPPNGSHLSGLHIATGPDVMPGHQPFPQTPHGAYTHPHSAGPVPGPSPGGYDAYYQGQHWSNSSANRKKPVRAQQACDSCRTRKAKCDEARPCSHCKDNQLTCTYREIPPHKQDRNAIALEAKFDSMQREMSDKLNRLLQVCETHHHDIRMLSQDLSPEKRSRISTNVDGPGLWQSSHVQVGELQPSGLQQVMMQPVTMQSLNSQRDVMQMAPPNAVYTANVDSESTNTLPHSHTTAAQNLLDWPTIAQFGLETNSEYVMALEENRGILRLYGRGEGHDKTDGSQRPTSPADSSSSSRTDESPSPPADSAWGYGFKPPYPNHHGLDGDHPGGLNPDGSPNYAADLVDKYFQIYMRHMYILHPFLDKKTIRDHVHQFKSRYSRERPVLKRKRREDGENSPIPTYEPQTAPPATHTVSVERSVRNAIVLLVLALGKICDHKAPLPSSPAAPSTATLPTSAPTPRSSNSDPFSPTPGSPYQQWPGKSKPVVASFAERHESEKANVDVIPGLAYYNVACDIIGGLRGGYDLSHVQAALLAGLYMGQLAQVIASHDWITQAGKICQVLIHPKKFPNRGSNKYLQQLKYAYWSCLQLESDILAEMPLPQSGISRYETFMNGYLPSGIHLADEENGVYQTDQNVDSLELIYYWGQIQLRITLNSAHASLYDGAKAPTLQLGVQESLLTNLELWRILMQTKSPEMGWSDDDYITPNINAARLRAKYYGAKVIINRPTLYAALHADWSTISKRPSASPLAGQGRLSQQSLPLMSYKYPSAGMQHQVGYAGSPVQLPIRSVENLKPEVRAGVEKCIHAAIRSTRAFDGVPPRLIVTNIFGTGHAQYGNMLILSAAYNSYLRSLIDGRELKSLFTRTIGFLGNTAAISPSLKRDMEQLKNLESQLFPRSVPGTTSSFSSSDS